jgi:hypothetical protein
VSSTKLEITESTSKPVSLPSGVPTFDEQARRVVFRRQILRNFRHDHNADSPYISVRLDYHGKPLFAALTGRVRKTNKGKIASLHGFSGRSSYSSQSSCLTLSQARA